MAAIQPFIGLAALIVFAWIVSENRRGLRWRVVVAGLAVQFALAILLLKLPQSQIAFVWLNDGVVALQKATEAGTSLVFGFLGGGTLPFTESHPGAAFILAFRALPLVLLMSALSALLYHWRVLSWIVRGFAWALGKALGISGAASFGAAANVFVGMVEAPLLIRPYLGKISRSDLFIVMTAGMATIAGTM
jgi:CNT family concentrative nucleoside transporter